MRRSLPIAVAIVVVVLLAISRISLAGGTHQATHVSAKTTTGPRQPPGVSTATSTATQTTTAITAPATECRWRRFRDRAIGSDLSCAPGQLDAGVAGHIGQTICDESWVAAATRLDPSPAIKDELLIEYRLPGNPVTYTVAHVIPVQDGGSPTSPRNLYPLALTGYGGQETHTAVAEMLNDEICDHEITVAQAARTLEGDWLSRGLPDDD